MLSTCSKNNFSHHFQNSFFKKCFITLLRTDTRVIIKQIKLLKTHKHERNFQNEQVPKSPQKTTNGKGANTFPFHNLPHLLRIILKSSFFVLFTLSLIWIKEKSVATLSYCNICKHKTQNQYITVGSATMSKTGDSAGDY